MSNKHVGAAWEVEGLSVYEKIVLLCLADDANRETGECWRGQKNIAARCGISRETANRCCRSLEEKGILSSAPNFDADGRQRSNTYTLLIVMPGAFRNGGGCDPESHTGVTGTHTGGVTGTHTSSKEDPLVEDPLVGSNISSEPRNLVSRADDDPGSGFFFPTCRKGVQWEAPRSKIVQWEEAYPNVDIDETLLEARQWLRDNPGKQKTASGLPRFIGRWLQRVQDG